VVWWTPALRYLRKRSGTNFYRLRWMISNCSWPSCRVRYSSSSRHRLLIRRCKIKLEEQQCARVLLLRKESGLGLSRKYPLVCKFWWGGDGLNAGGYQPLRRRGRTNCPPERQLAPVLLAHSSASLVCSTGTNIS